MPSPQRGSNVAAPSSMGVLTMNDKLAEALAILEQIKAARDLKGIDLILLTEKYMRALQQIVPSQPLGTIDEN
jgi:hypothetical protein